MEPKVEFESKVFSEMLGTLGSRVCPVLPTDGLHQRTFKWSQECRLSSRVFGVLPSSLCFPYRLGLTNSLLTV